jgi:DnaJ-class molecular chaperone
MHQANHNNYYKILGVEINASLKEIKKRYRELAKKHHPDVNKGSRISEDKFKIISEAYEVLKDNNKRYEYDQRQSHSSRTGHWHQAQDNWRDSAWEGEFWKHHRNDSGFEGDFGWSTGQEETKPDPNAPKRGLDFQFMANVPLKTVALGGVIPYTYDTYVKCSTCDGTGSVGTDECDTCIGTRQEVKEVVLDVKIPPGVADQFTLRVQDGGGEGRNGGPPGDLFLKICTLPHLNFKRHKNEVYSEVTISPELAEKGGTLKVETLDSPKTIQVKKGTLTGEELRIPGGGAAILWGKKRGDFIVKFQIVDGPIGAS